MTNRRHPATQHRAPPDLKPEPNQSEPIRNPDATTLPSCQAPTSKEQKEIRSLNDFAPLPQRGKRKTHRGNPFHAAGLTVARAGIEPATFHFSGERSTD